MLCEEGVVVMVLLLLISMVALLLLLLLMMLMLFRDFHLDFPNRRMNSAPRMAVIFVTCFFRGERERERGLTEEAISVGDVKCKWGLCHGRS